MACGGGVSVWVAGGGDGAADWGGAAFVGSCACQALLDACHEVAVAWCPGDVPESWADPGKALRELRWSASRTLEDMCRDAWAWQSSHPHGFRRTQ